MEKSAYSKQSLRKIQQTLADETVIHLCLHLRLYIISPFRSALAWHNNVATANIYGFKLLKSFLTE